MQRTIKGSATREGRVWIVAAVGIILLTLTPTIEASIYPVVDPLTITEVRKVEGGVEFSASALKHRDCPWRETRFFLGIFPDGVPLTYSPHRDPPQETDPGILTWDRIFVPVDEETLRSRTFAYAYHQCYGPDFPRTRSLFWRPVAQ